MAKERSTMLMHAITLFFTLATALSWTLITGIAIFVTYFAIKTIYNQTLSYEVCEDTATISRLLCEEHTMFTPDYYVYVNYQGDEFCLQDENLYKGAIIGKNVNVNVYRGYDREHKVRAMYITNR